MTIRHRIRRLTTKLGSSPVLPVLGWTKAVETVVATGPTLRWVAYAVVVTGLWVAAEDLREAADDVAEEVTE